MKSSKVSLDNLLGKNTRAKRKNIVGRESQDMEECIIHREIHGDKVYVPLNLERVWNSI
ncbi:hypothetical protein AB3Z07_03845 [Metabacillus halosaccharovorans]|uniref:Uncharacterized protein n=1 Tax=Metabacillus halosaccharovorans TaxID=930124 RepID=A0ABT3DJJ4_9BACI|nr:MULTISPECIES: hypothetical protein [Bacillaceae]MCM3443241.1 hypothetical protein [Metabacillus halosaccharovorans]MCV9887224.1 hypothetical protein [Metabacillus halosaccharovorans]